MSVFVILLRFSTQKSRAAELMEQHNQWIQRGFADRIFLMAGRFLPDKGGAILAHGVSVKEITKLVDEDPFVAEQVVTAEILEIGPVSTDKRLDFLLE